MLAWLWTHSRPLRCPKLVPSAPWCLASCQDHLVFSLDPVTEKTAEDSNRTWSSFYLEFFVFLFLDVFTQLLSNLIYANRVASRLFSTSVISNWLSCARLPSRITCSIHERHQNRQSRLLTPRSHKTWMFSCSRNLHSNPQRESFIPEMIMWLQGILH